MCDKIIMLDGTEIESIVDGDWLCNNTQSEILTWIVHHLPKIYVGIKLKIVRDPFGWDVNIVGVK